MLSSNTLLTLFLQNRDPSPGLPYWQHFVEQFYSPNGVLRQGVWNAQCGSKKFELSTPTLARYYWTHFTSGVKHMQMIVENAVEKELPTGYQMLDSNKTYFIYWFENGTQVSFRAHHLREPNLNV